jgi:hypothetical protein
VDGLTPVSRASHGKHLEAVQLLVSYGGNEDDIYTPHKRKQNNENTKNNKNDSDIITNGVGNYVSSSPFSSPKRPVRTPPKSRASLVSAFDEASIAAAATRRSQAQKGVACIGKLA